MGISGIQKVVQLVGISSVEKGDLDARNCQNCCCIDLLSKHLTGCPAWDTFMTDLNFVNIDESKGLRHERDGIG